MALTVRKINDTLLEMDPQPPPQSDPALLAFYDRLAPTLRAALPPPIGNPPEGPGSTPEQALARRDAAAIALVTSLAPADAAEAALAVQYVVAGAHASYSLWQVQQHPPVSEAAMKLRTQFARFSRESRRSRSLLLTLQEDRHKRAAADMAARKKTSPPHGEGQSAGGGLASPGGAAVAPPDQPPAPSEETKPAPPRRSPPALRLIQGGLAS